MAEVTNISWCDHTFNPWVGCERISPACDSCYAATWAKRSGHPELWEGQRRRTTPANWAQPLKWDAAARSAGKRVRVFCASLADVFDNAVPREWRLDLFGLIGLTTNIDWLILTKRIGNAKRMLDAVIEDMFISSTEWRAEVWPQVWLGATIANQAEADRDIPKLLATPARVRFLSCEPLLGPLDLSRYLPPLCDRGSIEVPGGGKTCGKCMGDGHACKQIDWVISGAESGGRARPSHPDWFRTLRDDCVAAGVAYHHKQHGEFIEVAADEKDERGKALQIEVGSNAAKLEFRPRTDCLIALGGTVYRDPDSLPLDTPARLMRRVGKKAAGRTLDGVIHDAFPAVRP
jgi:protein gp37